MRRSLGLGCVAALLVVSAAPGAVGAAVGGYADWQPLGGTSNAYTTRMELPAPGFPGADVASDSRSGSVGVQSGASVWLGPNTPVGLVFGSSQDRPYLNLRPKADNATAPSRTTYTFDSPTPPAGWAFVLGDIDADAVTVSAKDATGGDVSAAQLGFAGAFNLCDTSPRPGGCSTSVGDVPTWDPGTVTLTGNPTASDTFGAAGWFRPTVSLSSLTLTFTRRSGFPVYQTWFASVARTIAGTVNDVSGVGSCPLTAVTVALAGPDGSVLATTHPDASGAYSFGPYATRPDYLLSVEPAPGCAVVGAEEKAVDNVAGDGGADFDVRVILPYPVSGQVRTVDGTAIAGVTVTLHAPGGGTRTITTDVDGRYLFDGDDPGAGYFTSIGIPDGYTGTDQRPPFDIVDAPVTGQDFVLTANPDVGGTVIGGGAPLGGVTVTLTPSGGGPSITTTTAGDGSYSFTKVPAGTYDISVEPVPGFSSAPPRTDVVVAGNDITGQDFELERPGAIGGAVRQGSASGAGVGDVTVEVDGPGGAHTLQTDAAGDYFLGDLAPGSYQIRIVVPAGYDGIGTLTRTVTITAAGEIRSDQDFVILPSATPTPTPVPTPTTAGGGGGAGSPGTLPDVGGGSSTPLVVAGLLLGLGLILVGSSVVRRHSPRRLGP
jgi:hypothetical protein